MLFSERIRTLRRELGLYQRDLARAIDVDVPMYSRFEHGERRPKRAQVVKLARLLSTDPNELVALWLAESAMNSIGHDKMSARASQLLLATLNGQPMPPSDTAQAAEQPAQTEAQRVVESLMSIAALELPDANRNLVATLGGQMMPHYFGGDTLQVMRSVEDDIVDCIVTSLPCWALREHDTDSISASTPEEFVDSVLSVMAECKRALKPHGSLWLHVADARQSQSLLGLPWRIAIAMTDRQGWTLLDDVALLTGSAPGEDRPGSLHRTREAVLHFTLQPDGAYLNEAELRRTLLQADPEADVHGQPGDVWSIAPADSPVDHYVVTPDALCRIAIAATCPTGGLVLDPYCGTGTTCKVAYEMGRRSIGIDINPDRLRLARARVEQRQLSLF